MPSLPMPATFSSASSYEDPREYKAEQVREFLKKMSLIESSGGKNTDHPEVTTGVNAGTSAVGDYGIMPLTAQNLDKKYGINQLQDMNPDEVSDKLSDNPELQQRLAETFASKLLSQNPTETAAYKWQYGQNSHPDPEQIDQSDRIRKFRSLQNVK